MVTGWWGVPDDRLVDPTRFPGDRPDLPVAEPSFRVCCVTDDSIIWVPVHSVLFSGGLLFRGGTPFLPPRP
jgi:hypothetical protein